MVVAKYFTDQAEGAFKVVDRADGFTFQEAEDSIVHSVCKVSMCGESVKLGLFVRACSWGFEI